MIYDETEAAWQTLGNPIALVERAKRALALDHPVAFVTGNVIHFYADRATLNSDLERDGGATYENAVAMATCDTELNFELG